VKLQTLKPRLPTVGTRLTQADRVEVDRLRGRAAVERRTSFLYRNPLCVMCEREGRTTAATVPDHIVPLWANGADEEQNLQPLCKEHHDAKSACEARMRAAGGWLATSCDCGQHDTA
jgi:5-methylcytosine-specific restriction enzyme A